MDDFYFEEEDSHSGTGLDFRRYWLATLRRWWLWVGFTLLIGIPWVLYVKQEKPIYEAKATIQFRNFGGDDGRLVSRRQEELTSRTFAEQVVADLGLVMELKQEEGDSLVQRRELFELFTTTKSPQTGSYALRFHPDQTFSIHLVDDDDPEFDKKIYEDEIMAARTDTVAFDGCRFILAPRSDFPPEVRFVVKNFRKTVTSFQRKIDVSFNRGGTLMWVSLENSDPYLATAMTNLLADIFVEKSQSVKVGVARQQYKILKGKLDKAEAKLAASKRKLLAFRESNVSIGSLNSEADRLGTKLANLEAERDRLEKSKQTVDDLLKQGDALGSNGNSEALEQKNSIYSEIVGLDVFKGNGSIAVQRSNLSRLSEDYDQIVKFSSTQNENAIEIARQIRDVHAAIKSLANKESANLRSEIRRLTRESASLDRKLRTLPSKESEYAELVRENTNDQELFNQLNTSFTDLQLKQEFDEEEIRILDSAILPELPINGNKKAKAAMGLIAAFMMGLFVTVALEFLDKTMKTVADVKKHLRINVLGAIPEVNFDDVYDFQDSEKIKMIDNQLVTHDYSPTPIGEAYRSLRTSIMFSKDIGRVQTLVVTSMAPGDGKSFTSANLAITMAQQKSNTLLIDTDLRRGVQHNTFGLPKEPGFSNYLTNSMPLPEIVSETHIPNLSVISCGSLIPNPSELLGSHQMQRFLDEVRRRYDLVIFDTPPLNAATDAVVIGTQVDASIIVIRAGKTHRDVARQKLELYHHVPAKVMGIVLNGTSADLAHEGYSYYHY